ncbi:MAG: Plug domain-containing protein [Flavobacteriales bacterium AspAUS03]
MLQFKLTIKLSPRRSRSQRRPHRRQTPLTKTNLSKKEFQKLNIRQDLVYLIDQTPSFKTISDTGGWIGLMQIRIRGSDNSKVNVTVNGVPLNDKESHDVFWENTKLLILDAKYVDPTCCG